MGGVAESLSNAIFGKPATMDLPEAKVPAAPAPVRRPDGGADVVIGADKSKNARVSGGRKGGSSSSGGDVLGGLGRSGLSI